MNSPTSVEAENDPKIQAAPLKKKPAPILMCHQGEIPLAIMLPHAGDNVFRLIRMAMVRALDIHGGSKPLVEHDPADKATSIALNEIAQGKIAYKKTKKAV